MELPDASPRHSAPATLAFPWRRFVVWGWRLHEDTFSYIHEAYARAGRWLGVETLWLPDRPVDRDSFAGTLFFTMGLVDRHLPVRDDCFYVLHNCDLSRPEYGPIVEQGNYLGLQVFSKDVFQWDVAPLDVPGGYFFRAGRIVFMPWATDLLPDEMDVQRARLPELLPKRKNAAWVGTLGGGEFGNVEQLTPFIDQARALGLRWQHKTKVSREEHVRVIERALLAPAIVGAWQLEKGYVPCRIFKNASYGHIGLTNSPIVRDLFSGGLCLQDEDTAALCRRGFEWTQETPVAEQVETIGALMEEVRRHHTYVSRIRTLLDVISGL